MIVASLVVILCAAPLVNLWRVVLAASRAEDWASVRLSAVYLVGFGATAAGGVWVLFVYAGRRPVAHPRRGFWACEKCGYDIGPMDSPTKTCPECGTINDRPW